MQDGSPCSRNRGPGKLPGVEHSRNGVRVDNDRRLVGNRSRDSALSGTVRAGYSLTGNELTEFAGSYPKRVAKLVYLDAAYDLAENAELGRKAGLDLKLPGADDATLALIARSNECHPNYRRIRVPSLGFFVTYDEAPKSALWDEATRARLVAYWNDYGKAYRRGQIERFQREVKNARVVELHNTTHGGFLFEAEQQSIVLREMGAFLLDSAR